MTLAYSFAQHESGGFPIERAALGSCDLSVLHVGGECNGWSGKRGVMWLKVPRVPLSMHNSKLKPWRSSSVDAAKSTFWKITPFAE
jgi:hypothetical protein